jgi:probable rRNA maturation factor
MGATRKGSANLPPLGNTGRINFAVEMSDIHFFFPEPVPALRNRTALKSFLKALAKKEKHRIGSLQYVFCDDDRLLQINQDFLDHHDLTDIITFTYSEVTGLIEGEIYISTTRVRDNARIFGTSFTRELHRVIFHGLLHLCGYKDKLKADQQLMRGKEDHYLDLYFKKR